MSPTKLAGPRSSASTAALHSFFALLGNRLNEARRERRWNVQHLAEEAGVSRELAYLALRGERVSLDAALRMIGALGLKLEWELVDPRKRAPMRIRQQDPVHSAMGEFEAAHFRPMGITISIDEPYQHYQFAGRADLVAWNADALAILHIENRTRFPDLQEAAGSYNAKRAYLGAALADRIGIGQWRSETHVMVAFWSAEVLHALRIRTESFRATCPDDPTAFEQWWSGVMPLGGKTSSLIVLDPLAVGRQRAFISLEDALGARPRHPGYAAAAARLG
jgi:transcriptional regulator with XRE-family HTH domain